MHGWHAVHPPGVAVLVSKGGYILAEMGLPFAAYFGGRERYSCGRTGCR